MPVRKKDALRALGLLEEYRSKLSQTEDRQLRNSIERVINIFQSNLFQALIDIQEFYEVTLLDNQKCGESPKPVEPTPPVNLWEFSSLPSTTVTSETLPSSVSPSVEETQHCINTNQRHRQDKEYQKDREKLRRETRTPYHGCSSSTRVHRQSSSYPVIFSKT